MGEGTLDRDGNQAGEGKKGRVGSVREIGREGKQCG